VAEVDLTPRTANSLFADPSRTELTSFATALERLLRAGPRAGAKPGGAETPRETLSPHLGGVRGAFLLSGYRDMPDTLALMRKRGVERVALLLSSAAGRRPDQRGGSLPHRVRGVRARLGHPLDFPAAQLGANRADVINPLEDP
jgi:hypothetical protein